LSADYLEHKLLTIYVDSIYPGTRALNDISLLLHETKMFHNEYYDMMHKEEAF